METKTGLLTLPNFFTLLRLIVSPIMLPFLVVYCLPYNLLWLNSCLAALFIFFSITDFLDGYLARRYAQVSTLGRILDPIADKFLLYSMLIALLAAGKLNFIWVLLFIGREFFIMGLRQIALEHNITVHVSSLAKLKTFFQFLAIIVILLNPYHTMGRSTIAGFLHDFWHNQYWTLAELVLLLIALFLSIVSAKQYYQSCIHAYYRQLDQQH